MALSTGSIKGKAVEASEKAEAEVAAATAADVKAEQKAEPEDDAARAKAPVDPRLDSRGENERSGVRDWGDVVPQHINGPDLAGQAEYTKKYLASLDKGKDA